VPLEEAHAPVGCSRARPGPRKADQISCHAGPEALRPSVLPGRLRVADASGTALRAHRIGCFSPISISNSFNTDWASISRALRSSLIRSVSSPPVATSTEAFDSATFCLISSRYLSAVAVP
jgi:hypothetical protein